MRVRPVLGAEGAGVNLTANDERVLADVESACGEWDGYSPHGIADWTGVRRLARLGLVEWRGYGVCQTCSDPHDGPLFVLLDKVSP